MATSQIIPPPPGFILDDGIPPPPGFVLDAPLGARAPLGWQDLPAEQPGTVTTAIGTHRPQDEYHLSASDIIARENELKAAGALGLRIGGPLAAVASLPVSVPLAVMAALSAGGAALAEYPAQKIEESINPEDKPSLAKGAINVSAAALGPLAGKVGGAVISKVSPLQVGAPAAIRNATASAIVRGIEGGTINAAQDTAQRIRTDQPVTVGSVFQAGGVGALWGAALGVPFDAAARGAQLKNIMAVSQRLGFRGQPEELEAWWLANHDRLAKDYAAAEKAARWDRRRGSTETTAAEPAPSAGRGEEGGVKSEAGTANQVPENRLALNEPAPAPPRTAEEFPNAPVVSQGVRSQESGAEPVAPIAPEPAPQAKPLIASLAQYSRADRLGALARLSDAQLAVIDKQFRKLALRAPSVDPAEQAAPPAAEASLTYYNLAGKATVLPAGSPIPANHVTEEQWAAVSAKRANPAAYKKAFNSALAANRRLASKEQANAALADKAPSTKAGRRLTFGPSPDGVTDLIDAIMDMGGVPKPPKDERGGEWDGWAETFRGPARLLIGRGQGGIDTFVKELNSRGKLQTDTSEGGGEYNFASVDDFYTAIGVALERRRRAKARMEAEQQEAKLMGALLDNTGRSFKEKADPAHPVDSLTLGDKFLVKGQEFTVSGIDEDTMDVHLVGTGKIRRLTLPAGAMFYADKGSFLPAVADDAAWPMPEPAQTAPPAARPEIDPRTGQAAVEINPPPKTPNFATATAKAVRAWEDNLRQWARTLEIQVLGKEVGERYRKLQRTANSSDNARADAASNEIAAIESRLTPEQEDLLFGKNLPKDFIDLDTAKELVSTVDAIDSARDVTELVLGSSRLIQSALRSASDKTPLTGREGEMLARVMQRARELGITPQELVNQSFRYRARFEGADVYELAGVTPEEFAKFISEPAAPNPAPTAAEDFALGAQAEGAQAAEDAAIRARNNAAEEERLRRAEMAAAAERRLVGDNSSVGQGVFLGEDADLLSGPALLEQKPRASSGAAGRMGSPPPPRGSGRSSGMAGRAAAARTDAGTAGRPPPGEEQPPEVSDDPNFSQLGFQLPELVELYRVLSGGQVPQVRETIRLLKGRALGVFRYGKGNVEIELRADLFHLVSPEQRAALEAQAREWARLQKQADPSVDEAKAAHGKLEELLAEAEAKALKDDPRRAMSTLAHEIGHFIDYLPDATLKRGNILGHIAALRGHLKGFLAEHPDIDPGAPPTAAERKKLRAQAEKELYEGVKEIVETVTREEPIWKEVPLKAGDIAALFGNEARERFPALYDWFAQLPRADKVAVVKAAMKGIIDARAAAFGGREQVGTRTVTTEVRRRTGSAPTQEQLDARYRELLAALLKERGLISEADIRAELDTVIKWWQGTDEVPEYFRTAVERWAETFSALLNNPAGLAKRAPTFWRAFWNYAERRPAFKAAYEKLQATLRNGTVQRERVGRLRAMFAQDEKASLALDEHGAKLNWQEVRDSLRLLFDRQLGPLEARALAAKGLVQSERMLSALKNYLYRATAWEAFLRRLNSGTEATLAQAGLRHDDLAEYLFHRRIAAGDRRALANPHGWSPNTSAERLAEMERAFGPQGWAALGRAADELRALYVGEVVPLLKWSNILSPEMMELIEANTIYATFFKERTYDPDVAGTLEGMLEARHGKDVTAAIFRQIGTLKGVRSPYLATVQKSLSLISLAYRQMALASMVDYLRAAEPHNIRPAERRWTGKRWETRVVDTPKVATVQLLRAGQPEGWYVPRVLAETFERGGPIEGRIVGLAHRVMSWPKAVFTELNPGFWPVAFTIDVLGASLQLPMGHLLVRELPAAFQAARATVSGKPNMLATAALDRLMVISRADNRGEHLGHADEMTRILLRMGQNPALWDAEAKKIGDFLKFWRFWKTRSIILERTVKIAGMAHLDRTAAELPEWMKKRLVNELAGSPDFLEKGRMSSIVDLYHPFYNAWLQGLRGLKRAEALDRRGFWTKFLSTVGLATLAYWMFEKGKTNLGMPAEDAERWRDMMRSIPERDKMRGIPLPLGWADKDKGKAIYLTLPLPDSVRYLNTSLRSFLNATGGKLDAGAAMQEMLHTQTQNLPGNNPLLTTADAWWAYWATGQNPIDPGLGRGMLSDDQMLAGEGGAELLKQAASNLTGGVVWRYTPDRPGDPPTDIEKLLRTPVAGNIWGRWLKVSSRGLDEQATRDTAAVVKREAQLRLMANDMIARQERGEAWTKTQSETFASEPYLAQYLVDRQLRLMKSATGPEMEAWQRATSIGQRAALLRAWAQREAEREQRLKGK